MTTLWRIAIIAALVFICIGCAASNKVTVTNLPPGVSNQAVVNWIDATSDLDKAFAVTHAVKQSVIGIRNAGGWTDDASYAAALNGIGKALQLEIAGADALKQQPNNWAASVTTQVAGYATEAATALQDVISAGTIGVKNTTVQGQLLASLQSGLAVLKLVLSLTSQPVAQISPRTFGHHMEATHEFIFCTA